MKSRAAVALAVLLGIASTTAFAQPAARFQGGAGNAPATTWTGYHLDHTDTVRPDFHSGPGCPMSSAAEGNANQQTRPVMQYGQTSGGNRC